jgi:hypothetical protein
VNRVLVLDADINVWQSQSLLSHCMTRVFFAGANEFACTEVQSSHRTRIYNRQQTVTHVCVRDACTQRDARTPAAFYFERFRMLTRQFAYLPDSQSNRTTEVPRAQS